MDVVAEAVSLVANCSRKDVDGIEPGMEGWGGEVEELFRYGFVISAMFTHA